MKMFLLVSLVIITVGVLVFGGCAKPAPAPAPAPKPAPAPTLAPAEPITIGALLPLTGPMADNGISMKAGIELYLKKSGGKVAGRPVKIIIQDDGSIDTVKGLETAKRMVEVDKIKIMIGPMWGGMAMAVMPYLSKVPIPLLSVEQQIEDVIPFGWFFLSSGTTMGATRPVGWYTAEELKAKTAVCIYREDKPGDLFMGGWKKGFTEKGGTVIQEIRTPMGTVDYSSYLMSLKQADVVSSWCGSEMHLLIGAAGFGLMDKALWVLPHQANLTEKTMQDIGAPLLKIKAAGVAYSPLIDNLQNKEYLAVVKESGWGMPSCFHYEGYEAAYLAMKAIETTGGNTDPNKLKQAILGFKIETATGLLSYTPEGVGIRDIYVFNVKQVDGQYVWNPIKMYPQIRPEY